MILAEPFEVIRFIVEVFEQIHIPYLVGGSLASSLHGIPRATQDADIVAHIKPEHVQPIVKALESAFYVSENAIHEAIRHRSSFNAIHLGTMFKVDIFILGDDPGSQEEMRRRERYQVSEEPPEELYLASAEDIILHKLYWFQLGGGVSERQWNDVIGVLQVRGETLDLPYLQRRAADLGVEQLLAQTIDGSKFRRHES
jgi:hypothetical protein